MTRAFLVALFLSVAVLALPSEASACSCGERTAADYFDSADVIFVGRAHLPTLYPSTKNIVQRFDVLHPIKGVQAPIWTRTDTNMSSASCGASFRAGQIAVVLAIGTRVRHCHGNFMPYRQFDKIGPWLLEAGGKKGLGSEAAFAAAITGVLGPYLHDRPKLEIRHDAPPGAKGFSVGKTRFVFAPKGSDNAIEIDEAVTLGDLHLVRGHFKDEGVRFSILFDKTDLLLTSLEEQ